MESGLVYSHYRSPVGLIALGAEGDCLSGLWLEGQRHFEGEAEGGAFAAGGGGAAGSPALDAAKDWLDRYFAGERPHAAELSLCPAGGGFRQEVWRLLCEIPYGEVATYGDIAKKMAVWAGKDAMSAQAVGGAVGHNPISIIIPCHRVVGAGGDLTGYGGGIERKIWLLGHEGVDLARYHFKKRYAWQ